MSLYVSERKNTDPRKLTVADVALPARCAGAAEGVHLVVAAASVHARLHGALVEVDCRNRYEYIITSNSTLT